MIDHLPFSFPPLPSSLFLFCFFFSPDPAAFADGVHTPLDVTLLEHVVGGLRDLAFHEQETLQRMGEERQIAWQRILAWRLLYAALDPGQRQNYNDFLHGMEADLRDRLEPEDVIMFVRQCANVEKEQDVIIVWMFDEAHKFVDKQQTAVRVYQGPVSVPAETPATWIQRLLEAFVLLRVDCPQNTMPVCLVTSSLYSCTQLEMTDTSQARIANLQLVPLNDRQCFSIFQQVCNRVSVTGSPASPTPGVWPQISLALSRTLTGQNLPDVTKKMLLLCGGNPRMLAYTLASMAHVPTNYAVPLGKATCMCHTPYY